MESISKCSFCADDYLYLCRLIDDGLPGPTCTIELRMIIEVAEILRNVTQLLEELKLCIENLSQSLNEIRRSHAIIPSCIPIGKYSQMLILYR